MYERIVVVTEADARKTYRTAEHRLGDVLGDCYHRVCYLAIAHTHQSRRNLARPGSCRLPADRCEGGLALRDFVRDPICAQRLGGVLVMPAVVLPVVLSECTSRRRQPARLVFVQLDSGDEWRRHARPASIAIAEDYRGGPGHNSGRVLATDRAGRLARSLDRSLNAGCPTSPACSRPRGRLAIALGRVATSAGELSSERSSGCLPGSSRPPRSKARAWSRRSRRGSPQ